MSNPFKIVIKGCWLEVRNVLEGQEQVLCSLDLNSHPAFYISGENVYCRDSSGFEFRLDTAGYSDAAQLMSLISRTRLQHEWDRRWRFRLLSGVAAALFIGAASVFGGLFSSPITQTSAQSTRVSEIAAVQPAKSLKTDIALIQTKQPEKSAGDAGMDDGWELSPAVRSILPEKLGNAAARKLFTIDYSTGHQRTLFVFADPNCPNCQRLERTLNQVASTVNVVVFPVAVIGKDKSIEAIKPVLCLPAEQRKAAWDALFDVGRAGLSMGNEKTHEDSAGDRPNCEFAEKALGVNEVAFKAYQIPGTPWVISDDGRHVSQDVLRDPVKLAEFMDHKGASDASE